MKDFTSIFTDARSSSIVALLGAEDEARQQTAEAKRESLEHLLCIPIEKALNLLPTMLGDRLRRTSWELQASLHARDAGVNTFGELLTLAAPSLQLLKYAKEFAKRTVEHRRTFWPEDACKTLYYATYAAGVVRLHVLMGGLEKEVLMRGFEKLVATPWMPDDLRNLFERALEELPAVTMSTE